MKKRLLAFVFALRGIEHGWKREEHLRIHALMAAVAIMLGIFLQINLWEWCVILLNIGIVIGAELMNAAIERLADRITKEKDPFIGQAKDLAAGAVLIVSMVALVLGMIIFVPKLWLVFS
jgi:diacylglycerol kinase